MKYIYIYYSSAQRYTILFSFQLNGGFGYELGNVKDFWSNNTEWTLA